MKKKFLLGLALLCAMLFTFSLAACGGDQDPALGETDWGTTVEEFISESGVTAELQLFAVHYKDFTYKDGKYTASEIAATGGFTCKNIVITVEDEKIVKVEYELRTADPNTPDRLIVIDKDGITRTDVPKPSDNTQMDEEEWKDQAAVFSTTSNYTLSRVRVSSGEAVAAMKLDGTTYYETWNGRERIWDVENSQYVVYNKFAGSAEWTKDTTTQDDYDDAIFDPSTMVTVAAAAIEENFASFSFEAGVYTAAEIEIEYFYESEYFYTFTLKDVEITVSGGKIVRVVCTLVGGYDDNGDERITVDHVGSTEIEFPETFTDNTQQGGTGTGTETNEKMWEVCLSSANNFTLTNTTEYPELGTMTITFKLDGNKCEQIQSNGTRFVGVKDDETFTQYDYNAMNDTWFKEAEATFAPFAYETNRAFPAQLAEHFEEFSFVNGKYTCPKFEMSYMDMPALATDVEVVFVDNELVSISFTLTFDNMSVPYEFSAFGTTEVEIPTKNVVDNTQQGGGEGGGQGGGGQGGSQGGGAGSVTLTKETDFAGLVSDRVTEMEWRTILSDDSFANATIEWTYTTDMEGSGTVVRKCKTEGDNKYTSVHVEGQQSSYYYTSESGKMYGYMCEYDGDTYIRAELGEEERSFLSYRLICPDFSDSFSEFTYNDQTGAYEYNGTGLTASSPMEPDWTMNYVNIRIKFAGGKLAYISCDRVERDPSTEQNEVTEHYTFKCYDYGATDFELPRDFTVETPAPDLEGKTFTYARCEGKDGATPEEIATMEARITQLGGVTVTFGPNNTVHVAMGSTITQDGTYTVEGDTVTFHIEKVMYGSMELEGGATMVCTFDGTNLLMPSEDENNRVYFVLVEQKA